MKNKIIWITISAIIVLSLLFMILESRSSMFSGQKQIEAWCGNGVCDETWGENTGKCISDCPPKEKCYTDDDCWQGEYCVKPSGYCFEWGSGGHN